MTPGISRGSLSRLEQLIADGKEARFYWWRQWAAVRSAVLAYDRHECQLCRARGRYSKAVLVHHVKHLKDRPDLALSLFDPDTGERQLLSLCKSCHEAQHPESLLQIRPENPAVTAERWD